MNSSSVVSRGLGCAALVLASAAGVQASIASLTGNAGGRLDQGSITIGQNQTGTVPIPTVGDSGVVEAANTHLYAAGINGANLPLGTIGVGSGVLGASNAPSSGASFRMLSTGVVTYIDELVVTSATLPAGTPVQIQFSYQVAWSASAASSFPMGGDSIFGRSSITASSLVTSFTSAGANLDSFNLSAGDNRSFLDTGTGATITNGLFQGTQHVDMLINAQVGGVIQFSAVLDADTVAEVFPPGGVDNQTAEAFASAGLAFGASPMSVALGGVGDVSLLSTLQNAPFSPASAANPSNAEAGRLAIPTPGSAALVLLAPIAMCWRRREF